MSAARASKCCASGKRSLCLKLATGRITRVYLPPSLCISSSFSLRFLCFSIWIHFLLLRRRDSAQKSFCSGIRNALVDPPTRTILVKYHFGGYTWVANNNVRNWLCDIFYVGSWASLWWLRNIESSLEAVCVHELNFCSSFPAIRVYLLSSFVGYKESSDFYNFHRCLDKARASTNQLAATTAERKGDFPGWNSLGHWLDDFCMTRRNAAPLFFDEFITSLRGTRNEAQYLMGKAADVFSVCIKRSLTKIISPDIIERTKMHNNARKWKIVCFSFWASAEENGERSEKAKKGVGNHVAWYTSAFAQKRI